MTPRLTIVLGAGGVGKTTLASALALAHAHTGARAALLGVDPARRLRSALALPDVPEQGIRIPIAGAGSLERGSIDVALLDPSACVRRWVTDACAEADRARLLANPFLIGIADHLAAFTDAIGCARAVEWAERDPGLTELVLDTAPGTAAVELLSRPEKLLAFFDGRLVRWLARLARVGSSGIVARGSKRMLAGLADLSGASALRDFGELITVLERAIATMVGRLERARAWLAEPGTALVVVCAVNDDAADAAHALDEAVRAIGFTPTLIVLNRVLPDTLATWVPGGAAPQAHAFGRYVHNYLRTQERVRARLAAEHVRVLEVPDSSTLDVGARLDGLAALGEPLRVALSAASR